jgi:hypothetical protein
LQTESDTSFESREHDDACGTVDGHRDRHGNVHRHRDSHRHRDIHRYRR